MKGIWLGVALATATPTVAVNDYPYMKGTSLSDVCAANSADNFKCQTYIEGWVAGFLLAESFDANDLHLCIPVMTPADALPIVRSYLETHPDEVQKQFAARLVWNALYQGHHCIKHSN